MTRSTPSLAVPRSLPTARRLLLGLAACTVLAIAWPQPAQAQWKWRDKDGQVNVSDRPPPRSVPDKDILGRPSPDARRNVAAAPAAASAAPAATSAAPTALDREVQARKKQSEQDAAAKAKAEEDRLTALRAENCRAARSQLATMESGQRVARTNDKGEREILDDKARADEARRAREAIASECR